MDSRWYGWAGRILRVNLSSGAIQVQSLPEKWCRDFIGCRGINTKILYDEVGPEVKPLSEDNKIVFGTGPLEGTPIGMGRVSITTKSTAGRLAEGGFGGFWGPELKFAGYDHVVIEGKSEHLVYLWIDGDRVSIRDCSHLKGKTTWETDSFIKEEIGDYNIQVAAIGPAGENQVHASTVISTRSHSGGRAGVGQIMGSKNLKAIAVRGDRGVKVADPDLFSTAYDQMLGHLRIGAPDDHMISLYGLFGPGGGARLFNFMGSGCTRNHQALTWDEVEDDLSGERYLEKYVVKPRSCFCCPWPSCGEWFEVKSGEYAGIKGENAWSNVFLAMGYLVGCDSIPAALKVRSLCNAYGMDTLHVTYSIAWAMECRQRGILSIKDLDGIDLRWGNHRAMVQMVEKICKREGFGDVLAQGVDRAAAIVGRGSEEFCLTVKGLELDIYEHRNFYQVALGVATSETGPDHTRWFPPQPINPVVAPPELLKELGLEIDLEEVSRLRSPEGKGKFMKWRGDTGAVIESLPSCVFMVKGRLSVDFRIWKDLLNAVTGFDFTYDEMLRCGERIVNLERAYIAREGYRRQDDTIPRRMMTEPAGFHDVGPLTRDALDKMLDDYYDARGWDRRTAVPTARKLEELRLGDVAKDLRQRGVM